MLSGSDSLHHINAPLPPLPPGNPRTHNPTSKKPTRSLTHGGPHSRKPVSSASKQVVSSLLDLPEIPPPRPQSNPSRQSVASPDEAVFPAPDDDPTPTASRRPSAHRRTTSDPGQSDEVAVRQSRDWSAHIQNLIQETELAFESRDSQLSDFTLTPLDVQFPRSATPTGDSSSQRSEARTPTQRSSTPKSKPRPSPLRPMAAPGRISLEERNKSLPPSPESQEPTPTPREQTFGSKAAAKPPPPPQQQQQQQQQPNQQKLQQQQLQQQTIQQRRARRPEKATHAWQDRLNNKAARWNLPENVTDILTGQRFKRIEADEMLTPARMQEMKREREREETLRLKAQTPPPRRSDDSSASDSSQRSASPSSVAGTTPSSSIHGGDESGSGDDSKDSKDSSNKGITTTAADSTNINPPTTATRTTFLAPPPTARNPSPASPRRWPPVPDLEADLDDSDDEDEFLRREFAMYPSRLDDELQAKKEAMAHAEAEEAMIEAARGAAQRLLSARASVSSQGGAAAGAGSAGAGSAAGVSGGAGVSAVPQNDVAVVVDADSDEALTPPPKNPDRPLPGQKQRRQSGSSSLYSVDAVPPLRITFADSQEGDGHAAGDGEDDGDDGDAAQQKQQPRDGSSPSASRDQALRLQRRKSRAEDLQPEESDQFVYLKSTPYTLTKPMFMHGPIAVSKAEIGKGAMTMDETLDWSAFQMAILCGAGDFFQGSQVEDADERLADELAVWFDDFGFGSCGQLIPEDRARSREHSPRQPSGFGLGHHNSGYSAMSSASSSSSSSSLSSTASNSDHDLPIPVGQDGSLHQSADDVKFFGSRDDLGGWGSGGPGPFVLAGDGSTDDDDAVPMGCNMTQDLGDFLRWEAQHMSGPFM